ncbi:hypothetical protein EN742_02910 [Mesorhizobium sp. M4A.F.Ca.ET.020.02.1.1]|uniref:hypothetical protein n=1 Tax=Mesorhizobium sp. M4A.F.Ca.ET.020.02.1.1 TaxID=2496652 RepID=UPI000FD2E878|nr:hypothetical protein [Mesorhizobium sp. M4A.F.Ca.ET.020.02.1.1]RVD44195.1 hypothetical protein EN742_02910 [Mesorhizobium sp. M4A.F.Ca.ET.020.02.1.1]
MKFCGESENVIARALGVAVETLRKHCADELADGHAHRRKELTSLLFTSARAGNVSAQKHLDALGRAAGADETVKSRAPRPARLGKKEEQQAAAEAVASASKFAPPAPPKLVVDNR